MKLDGVDGRGTCQFGDLLRAVGRGETLFVPLLVETVPPEVTERTGVTGGQFVTGASTGIDTPGNWLAGLSAELGTCVTILLGPNRPFAAPETALTIGRADGMDIQLPSHRVSKRHASLMVRSLKRTYAVIDHHSKNGTYINGERIPAETEIPVWAGAYVTFADAVYLFLDPSTVKRIAQVSND